jgi:hypothetical protein
MRSRSTSTTLRSDRATVRAQAFPAVPAPITSRYGWTFMQASERMDSAIDEQARGCCHLAWLVVIIAAGDIT